MKITGNFQTRIVRVDGRVLSPKRSQKIWNHSPDGFSWGYGGSGPAQLALAILLRAGLKSHRAVMYHQQLKREVIQPLGQRDFELEFDIFEWLDKNGYDKVIAELDEHEVTP